MERTRAREAWVSPGAAGRRGGAILRGLAVGAFALGLLLAAVPAGALRVGLWGDAELQVHGFYEAQIRAIARDLQVGDGLDLTQWYNIVNIEAEFDLAPDGFGPFDLVSAFVRIEARYDCIYSHGCSIFDSADTYGNRAGRLPKRLSEGRRAGYRSSGNIFNGDTRALQDIPREFLPFRFRDRPDGSRKPSPLFDIEGLDTLYDSAGVDGVFATADDPAPFYFSEPESECRFAFRERQGSQGGVGVQNMLWNPDCNVDPIGVMRNRPNPLRAGDISPITGSGGSGALPLRPAPDRRFNTNGRKDQAMGVFLPNERLAEMLRDDEFGDFDQNYSQRQLAWNRGASQKDEGELKEAYFDIEMFDSALWLRLGKQSVVWGKTELFRNQDRWNPQDLALASLPALEESRIGLWMARAVWQFWNVGPVEDLRAELVFTYDQFEPTDIGRCGEPYAPNPVCDKTFGLFIHGLTGFAVAGEVRPEDPWDSWSGIEVGGRLEWRWDRFSFAISDYYGYRDLPYQDTLFAYSRNVDPLTGRPRQGERTGRCKTGGDSACLTDDNALEHHSVNQQLFHMICATSLGFTNLDPTACAQTVFNSTNRTGDDPSVLATEPEPRVVVAINSVVAGDPLGVILPGLSASLAGLDEDSAVSAARLADQMAPFGVTTPLVLLNVDPGDGGVDYTAATASGRELLSSADFGLTVDFFYRNVDGSPRGSLSGRLSDAQEALLGCGPFYGTSCDLDGIDLMNAEASALFQSFPGFEGTVGDWDTTDGSVAQPGTVGYEGGPACTRYQNGKLYILPGCRAPGDSGYSVSEDGSPTGLLHPFTKQPFRSEMAALSWNALVGLVGFSADPEEAIDVFLLDDVMRKNGCSFAKPQFCSIVQSIFQVTGVQRNTIRAGGTARFGRRDWVWHGGKDIALRYQKTNVLGFSMDFAEDVTKSNWGLEFTWENAALEADFDELDSLRATDLYNLTISVDRPTFINFLNANRTFFINTQWFVQYASNYRRNFATNGPWNVLAVLAINTGYFDDRMLPSATLVYDFGSNSGALIPQVQYRFTAAFSATVGMALFMGREETRSMAITPTVLSNRTGRHAYSDFVENGLSAIRDRDEIFLRIRYTF